MWSESNFLSVSNFYTVRGLELLAELAQAAGRSIDAKQCADAAADLRKSVLAHMWDPKDARFCDGICEDVGGNHSIYSDMYSLWLGLVPDEGVKTVWNSTVGWGMEHLGDLGMFAYVLTRERTHISSLLCVPQVSRTYVSHAPSTRSLT
jgi:hypothetical protein